MCSMCSNNSLHRNVMRNARNARLVQTCCLTVVCQVPDWTSSVSCYLRSLPSCRFLLFFCIFSPSFLRFLALSFFSVFFAFLAFFSSWPSLLFSFLVFSSLLPSITLGPKTRRSVTSWASRRSREIKGDQGRMANDGKSLPITATNGNPWQLTATNRN